MLMRAKGQIMRRVVAPCVAAVIMLTAGYGAPLLQVRTDDLDVVQVRADFYMIAGAGGNVAVQVGPAGVILVDTGLAQMSDKVLTAVQRLTGRRIRYIINTSSDARSEERRVGKEGRSRWA